MAVNTFPGLVHTARHTMEAGHAWMCYLNFYREKYLRSGYWLGWSRNKVAVLEGVAGTTPYDVNHVYVNFIFIEYLGLLAQLVRAYPW